jgi:hypothetical protein
MCRSLAEAYHAACDWAVAAALWAPHARATASRWKGPQRTSGSCPCAACGGQLEDPVHYVLECAGLAGLRARYPAVLAAASTVAAVGPQAAMRALFQPSLRLC